MPQHHLFRLVMSVYLLVFLAGCGGAASEGATPTPAEAFSWSEIGPLDLGGSARFENADCMFPMPQEMPREEIKVECGYLTVPEDRRQPDTPELRLAVAIYKTPAEDPKPDPLLILMGAYGPILQSSMYMTYLFRQVFSERDLVFLEQRGTGYSEPDLSCAGLNQLYFDTLLQDPYSQEINDRSVDLRRACRQVWEAKGIQISAYTTTASAQDLEDLRQALGYRKWNIFAIGLGTRQAFELARLYPQSLRSIVMDTAIPPQGQYFAEGPANAQRALETFFQKCAQDTRCSETYPDLENVFYDQVDRLNNAPVTVEISDLNQGRRLQVLLTGDRLIDIMLMGLNMAMEERVLLELPRTIFRLRDGNVEKTKDILGMVLPNGAPGDIEIPELIMCNEDLLPTPEEKVREANNRAIPQLASYFNRRYDANRQICEALRFPQPVKGNKEPVTSSVPTLFLSGEFTPDVPPAWAELASSSIRPSYLVEFTNAGPFAVFSNDYGDCSVQIIKTFLADTSAKPDATCASAKKTLLWITLP